MAEVGAGLFATRCVRCRETVLTLAEGDAICGPCRELSFKAIEDSVGRYVPVRANPILREIAKWTPDLAPDNKRAVRDLGRTIVSCRGDLERAGRRPLLPGWWP